MYQPRRCVNRVVSTQHPVPGTSDAGGYDDSMGNVGAPELLVVLVIVLVLFGATRLPALGRSLGASLREFRKGLEEDGQDDADDSEPPGS